VYRRKHPDLSLPSLSSFKRVLEKCGLVEKRRRRRRPEPGRIRNRVEAYEPNDVWTVDFKGWWYTSRGERCEPLSVRDDFSRYLLGLSVPESCGTEPVQRAFEGLFERYGLPRVIRSDNGVPFASKAGLMGLTRLSVWWLSLGIDLDRIRPGCPSENGAHERMHRDIAMELEGTIRGDLKQQEAILGTWRRQFNEERPHEALGMKYPSEVYESSPRRYEGTPDRLEYPAGFLERRVTKKGCIKLNGTDIFVSVVFGGWNLGLESTENGEFSVYFDRLLLGWLDLRMEAFQAVSDRLEKRSADATE
jgi:transposase InsO family protein